MFSKRLNQATAGLAGGNFSLPAILVAEELHSAMAKALTSAYMLGGTVRRSLRFAEVLPAATALNSTTAVALADGVIRAMMTAKVRIYGIALLTFAFFVVGAHTLGRQLDGTERKQSQTQLSLEPKNGNRLVIVRPPSGQTASFGPTFPARALTKSRHGTMRSKLSTSGPARRDGQKVTNYTSRIRDRKIQLASSDSARKTTP